MSWLRGGSGFPGGGIRPSSQGWVLKAVLQSPPRRTGRGEPQQRRHRSPSQRLFSGGGCAWGMESPDRRLWRNCWEDGLEPDCMGPRGMLVSLAFFSMSSEPRGKFCVSWFCQGREELWVGGLWSPICDSEIYSDNHSEEFTIIQVTMCHLSCPTLHRGLGDRTVNRTDMISAIAGTYGLVEEMNIV